MNDLEEIEAMLAESVQEWTEAWKIAGLKQGLEQGRQSQATMVLRQLELKFGSLPADVCARVQAASTDQLLKWSERLLAIDHLDDLFQPG